MDGVRTLNEKEALEGINRIQPRITVPIHFRWHSNGRKVVKKVKEASEGRFSFREMAYGEMLDLHQPS
jgi:hypothetical protein